MEAKPGKYLTFSLKNENYGIPIFIVKEIIAMLPITSVPKTPPFIKGVINLRGKIIPIMDLRLKFSIEEKPYTDRTSIIVIDIKTENSEKQMGIAVDNVSEVLDIRENEIEPFSNYDTHIDGDFIIGIGKIKEKVYMLLDAKKILNKNEMKKIGELEGEING